MDTKKYLYKYRVILSCDYKTPKVHLDTYEIVSETKCGYWIKLYAFSTDKKWVSKSSRKRFAHDTLEGAEISYIKRTSVYISILEDRIKNVKRAFNVFIEDKKENALTLYCIKHKVLAEDIQYIDIKVCEQSGYNINCKFDKDIRCSDCTGYFAVNKSTKQSECILTNKPGTDLQGKLTCQYLSMNAKRVRKSPNNILA